MARQRKHDLDKQTHFARTHQEVMNNHYLTDIDSLQIMDTENEVYQHYTYINAIPVVRRIIEVKSRMSEHLKAMFSGEIQPTQQVKAQAYMVAELNGFRRESKWPLMEYYFVVEDFNEYPYTVWNVTTTRGTGEIQFKQIATIYDHQDYKTFFTTSRT